MADVFNKKKRSDVMSKVKSTNTKPEMIVRRYLHALGFRYRLYVKSLPGKPDIVFKSKKIAVFINGCYWHGHEPCNGYLKPKTNKSFWRTKIKRNRERDKGNIFALRNLGYKVFIVWECQLKKSKIKDTMKNLVRKLV